MKFSWGGHGRRHEGLRLLEIWRPTELEPSSSCCVRGVRKTLSVCWNASTAHLLQGGFPTMCLGGGSPPAPWGSSEKCGHGHTHVLQPWSSTEILFQAFITLSCRGAKAMAKLEKLSLTAAFVRRQERACTISSSWNRLMSWEVERFIYILHKSSAGGRLGSSVEHDSPTAMNSHTVNRIQTQDPILSPRELLGLEGFPLCCPSIDAAEQVFISICPRNPLPVGKALATSFLEEVMVFSYHWLTQWGTSVSCSPLKSILKYY